MNRIAVTVSKWRASSGRAGVLGLLLALALISGVAVTRVWAIPQMPAQFYGSVTINGNAAPAGVAIEAKISGTTFASTTTDSTGRYGYPPVTLFVPADDSETPAKEGGTAGDTIQFYVAGVLGGTAVFQTGAVTLLNLAVTTTAPTPTPTPGPSPTPAPTATAVPPTKPPATPIPTPPPIVFTEVTVPTSGGQATSSDGRLTVNVPAGVLPATTTVTLSSYAPAAAPPAPTGFIVGATTFSISAVTASGTPVTTLSAPITITVHYTASDLALAGGNPANMKLGYNDDATGKWVVLDTTFDPVSQTLAAVTSHLSKWAIMNVASVSPSLGGSSGLLIWVVLAGVVLLVSGLLLRRKFTGK